MKSIVPLLFLGLLGSCQPKEAQENPRLDNSAVVILGNVQDAGSPQVACEKDCCKDLFDLPDPDRQVTSLGLIDADNGKSYLFDATPDMVTQMKVLSTLGSGREVADGIFLTHAHIGHYTGLMFLGREAMNAQQVPVYAMPRMKSFLEQNGPWSQLVSLGNIRLTPLKQQVPVTLSQEITVTPLQVPHRDEFSETVGYRIKGPNKTALFIPDIDKWERWELDIRSEVLRVDYAFLDATFYSGEELNTRDISEIPHPFVIESLETFKGLSKEDRSRVVFIHFNHTNPLLEPDSEESRKVRALGFRIGRRGDVFEL